MYLVNHGKKGTARRSFQGTEYKSAGKSGTAQVFGLAEDQEYNADEIADTYETTLCLLVMRRLMTLRLS
ncbi:penicillin-binding protein 2 [Vibrio sp. JCM 19236]|nr:penicillin-binding protein 2 [Vibrio sp. JCM 19236]